MEHISTALEQSDKLALEGINTTMTGAAHDFPSPFRLMRIRLILFSVGGVERGGIITLNDSVARPPAL